MNAIHFLLLLSATLPFAVATRPDTVPDSDLRPVRPPHTSTTIREPIVLPETPFHHAHWMEDYEGDYDYDTATTFEVVTEEAATETFTGYTTTTHDDELEPKACQSNEFRCSDGQCLDSSLRCDSKYDCQDGTDELSCDAHQDRHVYASKGSTPRLLTMATTTLIVALHVFI